MKFRIPLTLVRVIVVVMVAQQASPLLAQSKDGNQKEVRPKTRFTAAELIVLVPSPRPEDVRSPKALVLALHDSISGPIGPFNSDRFRSLFLPTATIGEAGLEASGKPHIVFQSVRDWIVSVGDLRPRVSVHETVYKMRIEQFGSIATGFYSHNSVTSENGTTDIRRVNACEMLYDVNRWWIASVVWNVIPKNWDLPQDLEP